jgi:membrane-associated phospholipid phosphatase
MSLPALPRSLAAVAPGRSTALATAVSRLFSPWLVGPVTIWLTALAGAPHDHAGAAWWTLQVTLLIVAPLLLYVLVKSAAGELSGMHVAVRQQRDALYLAELLLLLAALLAMTHLHGPRPLRLLLISLALALLLFYIINRHWKISLHAASIGGAAVILWQLYGGWSLWLMMPAAVAVMWSRVQLRQHTPLQTVSGFTLAAAVTLLVFLPEW